MTGNRLRVVVIIGSIRHGRFGPTVANWFATQACQRDDLEVDVVDLAEAWLPEVLPEVMPGGRGAAPAPRAVRDLAPWLAAADAFAIVTPEYNRSFPGSLKTAIDWYREEWQAKPVAFVSYGGAAGGLRAVEQLRQVFAAVGAVTIRETVSLRGHRERFDDCGQPRGGDACDAAADCVLDQLTWWASILRDHRAGRPTAARPDPVSAEPPRNDDSNNPHTANDDG